MKRLRKIVATFFLVVYIIVYSLFAIALAGHVLPEANAIVEFIYYAFVGLFWVIPAGFIIWLGWRGEKAIQPGK